MKKLLSIALIAVAALAAGVPAASAATREYEGTVVSVNRDNRTFRLRDSERGTVTHPRHEQHALRARHASPACARARGNIEATVRRSNGRWVALEVERSGGGGNHGGRRRLGPRRPPRPRLRRRPNHD